MEGQTTFTALEIFVGLVAASAVIGLVARRVAVPYTVALVVFGLAAAVFAPQIDFAITEELVLVVLLPGLIFEASYNPRSSADRLRAHQAAVCPAIA